MMPVVFTCHELMSGILTYMICNMTGVLQCPYDSAKLTAMHTQISKDDELAIGMHAPTLAPCLMQQPLACSPSVETLQDS